MVTLARRVHLKKASSPILVTLLGMVMLARPVHPEKAPTPMFVTLLGMVTLARPVHPEKALPPMVVTLLGTALQLSQAYSYVCFITHKSILHKELSQ